ncbi:putative Oxaloacetate decarboxylase, gamma subunit [Nitrospina gracilis 3/211]|uniref:Putative Oxaloacetate decarboxylase, gamma subunit n=1 Tax=Nitrospina gracilis (strain 3/211) TaxID=1266370 RepID=M1Z872_NITG3|nr:MULTISPECIES: OadG family transporter subunit [Nitrospina]MCF8722522.1 sodium pump decarboxylase gamma subunit [Nitrospina sp. Nb-3]CCQ89198.1 putative Oxaloacetate decarboxylase, gamma subunit [Nitrospina gracilis 3/211]
MSPLILTSIKVSFLALGVIFLVLGILIAAIKVMTSLIPYRAPAPVPAKTKPTAAAPAPAASQEDEHIAAIQAVMAHRLSGQQNLQITQISSK